MKEKYEEQYIENMITFKMNQMFNSNEEREHFEEIKNLAKEMVIKAQNFIREEYDVSSVSLREIRRFVIFF